MTANAPPDPEVGTRPPTRKDVFQDLLSRAAPLLSRVAAKSIDLDRLRGVAMMAVTRQPGLLECHPPTVIHAILRVAEMGLELGTGYGHAYLVPFRNERTKRKECQLIIGYQGMIELALRSERVKAISSKPWFAEDVFDYEEGSSPRIYHKPKLDGERTWASLLGCYMIAQLDGGLWQCEVMTKKEIAAIRARSKSGEQGPWNSDTLEMAKKCPVRRGSKYLPKGRDLARAVALDEEDEGVTHPGLFDVDVAFGEAEEAAKGSRTDALTRKLQPSEGEGRTAQDEAEEKRFAEE
jgi:recombination protein RecT